MVDTTTNNVVSDNPVQVKMLQGTVNSKRLEVTGGGEVVRFIGDVKMTLDNLPDPRRQGGPAVMASAKHGSALARRRRTGGRGACGGAALAQAGRGAAAPALPTRCRAFRKNRDKPVQIEAATLEVRDKEKMATFSGNVHVVQGDTTMRCKVLVVHYDNEAPGGMKAATPGPGGQQQITRLEAQGRRRRHPGGSDRDRRHRAFST